MKTVEITVTEAARNFAECVNRVRYQDVSFVLTRNGHPVARIVPEPSKPSTGSEIAEALRRAGHQGLSPEESKSWRKDLEEARNSLLPPEDKWA